MGNQTGIQETIPSYFQEQPLEILYHQLSLLDYPSLKNFCRVNKTYSRLCHERGTIDIIGKAEYKYLWNLLVSRIVEVLDEKSSSPSLMFKLDGVNHIIQGPLRGGEGYDLMHYSLQTTHINRDELLSLLSQMILKHESFNIKAMLPSNRIKDILFFFESLPGSERTRYEAISVNINSILQSL